MNRFVVIVAGGVGSRMGWDIPKQFILLHDKPVIIHTIERFFNFDPCINIIVALPEKYFHIWEQIAEQFGLIDNITVVSGGKQRFNTVQNALKEISDNSMVAIHDAVRPLVSMETITKSFELAGQYGSAIPYTLPGASVRFGTENNSSISIDRNKTYLIQTPQTFLAGKLKRAYQQDYRDSFTDDAAVWEHSGNPVVLFEGNPENIKITFPIDLKFAEFLLSNEKDS